MNKKLIILLLLVATPIGFNKAQPPCKRINCEPRTVSGRVRFSHPQVMTPVVPCLPTLSSVCSTTITTNTTVLSGKGCFTTSPGFVKLLQKACNPLIFPSSCPNLYMSSLSYYDVTFNKPFKQVPAVMINLELTPVAIGDCVLGFTLPFTGGAGTGQPVQPQQICDPSTTFLVSIISVTNFATNVTTKGFTSQLAILYAACPTQGIAPTSDEFCSAIIQLVLMFYPEVPFHFVAAFTATGE